MVRSRRTFEDGDGCCEFPGRFSRVFLCEPQCADLTTRPCRLDRIRPLQLPGDFEHAPELWLGALVFAKGTIRSAHRQSQFAFGRGVGGEPEREFAAVVVEQLTHGVSAAFRCRIDRLEHPLEQRDDLAGAAALLARHRFVPLRLDQRRNGHAHAHRQRRRGDSRGPYCRSVTPHEFPQPIPRARRACLDRFVTQMAFEIAGKFLDRRVAPRPIFFERLHRDPVEITGQARAQRRRLDPVGGPVFRLLRAAEPNARRRSRRIMFEDQLAEIEQRAARERACVDRRCARQQFIKDDTERKNVGTGVHTQHRQFDLLGADVSRCAHEFGQLSHECFVGQRWTGRLGYAEVDHLRHGAAVDLGDQNIRRFEISVDDALLVGVLHAVADVEEEAKSRGDIEPVAVAKIGDRFALDKLHREKRAAICGRSGFEHTRDMRVVHEGERLALRFEPRDHLACVHAGFEHFDCNHAPDRLALLGAKNDAESAVPDLLEQAIRAKPVARLTPTMSSAGPPAVGSSKKSPAPSCALMSASRRFRVAASPLHTSSRKASRAAPPSSSARWNHSRSFAPSASCAAAMAGVCRKAKKLRGFSRANMGAGRDKSAARWGKVPGGRGNVPPYAGYPGKRLGAGLPLPRPSRQRHLHRRHQVSDQIASLHGT